MKYAKLTLLTAKDLQAMRGALRLSIDETQVNYFPGAPEAPEQLASMRRCVRIIKKLDAAEIALEQRGVTP